MCRITLFPTDAAACSKLYTLRLYQKVMKSLGKVLEYPPREPKPSGALPIETVHIIKEKRLSRKGQPLFYRIKN